MNSILSMTFVAVLALVVSCGNKEKTKYTEGDFISDTIYERVWLSSPTVENPDYGIEFYISNVGDTIENQYERYVDGVVDTLKSEFYHLEVYKTNKPHNYKGMLTLHSRFDTLQVDENNRRRLQFMYYDFGDSVRLKSVASEVSNRLEFEFQNNRNEHLTGVLIQDVFRDTIKEGEDMLNYRKTRILVDTRDITDNTFIYSHRFLEEKRINKN